MKKLSQLPYDATLTVMHRYDGDMDIMDKEDFLDSAYFLDYPVEPFPDVTVADRVILKFDLFEAIRDIGYDESYEGWEENVYDSLKDLPETKAFLKAMQEALEQNPIYWEGEHVEIDMVPKEEES